MLEHHGFENVRLWPRGVDMALFSPTHRSLELREQWMGNALKSQCNNLANQKCVLLYVGRISFEKNIGLLLDAYKQMDHTKCHLVCVGHGPAFEDIQHRYCDNGADNVLPITFTGYLEGKDLATAYASADVFAFPSTTETFGQVILEAMASALPVVGLDAEGICDLIDHDQCGLLLDTHDDVLGYKRLLERSVNQHVERKRMGQNALAKSKSYTWRAAMNQMVNVYKDAIGDQSNRCSDISLVLDRSSHCDDSDSGVEEDYLSK
jgi:glycosyltransferase involved in cell wall biosynthesis